MSESSEWKIGDRVKMSESSNVRPGAKATVVWPGYLPSEIIIRFDSGDTVTV